MKVLKKYTQQIDIGRQGVL